MIDPNKDNGVSWLINIFKSILQWITNFYDKNKNIFRKIYDPKDWIGKYKKEKKSINVFKLIFYDFFLIVILIMAMDSIDLFYFRGKILHTLWNFRVFRHFFVDKDGKFIWLGATSIITVITLGVNAWDNRRKFKADLVSKSRLEWVKRIEKISADYYGSYSSLLVTSYYYVAYTTINELLQRWKYEVGTENSEVSERVENMLSNNKNLLDYLYTEKSKYGLQVTQLYAELKLAIFNTPKNQKLFDALEAYNNTTTFFGNDFFKIKQTILFCDVKQIDLNILEENVLNNFFVVVKQYNESIESKNFYNSFGKHMHREWELAKNGD